MLGKPWAMTRSVLLLFIILSASNALTGCANNRVGIHDPVLATRSAQQSRIAGLIKYDDEYERTLTKMVETMHATKQAGPDTVAGANNQLALFYALDELAEIYAFRTVNFEKAAALNTEAETLGARITCCPKEDRGAWWHASRSDVNKQTSGYFFPRHRVLYAFVFNPKFDSELLLTVAREDFTNARSRIRERKAFLAKVLGDASAGLPIPEDPEMTESEFKLWEKLLKNGLPENKYAGSLRVLDRLWLLKGQGDDEQWWRSVRDASQAALLEERQESRPQPRDSAPLHFRAGLANFHFNQLQEGVKNFEEMLQAIGEYEAHEKSKLETVRNAESLSTWQMVTGVVWMPVWFVADPFGVMSKAVSGAIKSNRDAATIQALFGNHLNGLPSFLNEHERVAFHSELGYAYERLNRKPEAIPQYIAAIELIERERSSLGSEGKRIEFLMDKEIVYKRLVPLLIEGGRLEDAWQYMERARSRAFVDLLAGSRLHLGNAADTDRYQAVIQKQAEMEMLVQEGRVPREVVPQIHGTLRGIKTVKDDAKPASTAVKEDAKAASTAEFDSLAAVQTATIADVQSVAGRDAAVLAYFVSEEKTTLMLLQDGRLTAWAMPVGRERLTQQIQQFRGLLESPGKQGAVGLQEIHARGRELYRDLMAPPAGLLSKSVLYILPHGPLHYLPFSALYDGSGYVMDRVTLLTVPSATVLTYLEKKPRARKGETVVFANPDLGDAQFDLPYADQEGTAIHARVPASVLLRRGDATEIRARSRALDAKVLHFAAHATFKQDRPLDSAVMLAPGGGQDGALTAGEIFGLTLPGSLVVLSACETGRGKLAAGDELIGLTRAFMYAGAPQLLATLWQVDDRASSLLMDEFYRELATRPPADALRFAQTKVRATFPHPFYWAAFTTYGLYR